MPDPRYAKQRAYQRRCRAEGRCPHCGKPCLPYAYCDERRAVIRERARQRRIKAAEQAGREYRLKLCTKEVDARCLPHQRRPRRTPLQAKTLPPMPIAPPTREQLMARR